MKRHHLHKLDVYILSSSHACARYRKSVSGLCIIHVFRINIITRTAFYKARTRLGPQTSIWINEDLIKINEGIAYEARQLVGRALHKTWTYLGQVFVQYSQNTQPRKITRLADLPDGENIARRRRLQQNRTTQGTGRPTIVNPRQDLPTQQMPGTSAISNFDSMNFNPRNHYNRNQLLPNLPPSMHINNRPVTNQQQRNLIDWENESVPPTVMLQPLQPGTSMAADSSNNRNTSRSLGEMTATTPTVTTNMVTTRIRSTATSMTGMPTANDSQGTNSRDAEVSVNIPNPESPTASNKDKEIKKTRRVRMETKL